MIQTCKVFALLPLFALASSICPAQKPHVYRLSGDVAGTHDPSIIKEGKTWYVFATGKAPGGGQLAVRCSADLEHWKLCDVHHEYRLYYAYSLFGKNTSGIALATSKTLDPTSPNFKWVDKGLVLESKTEDNFNAIDPNFVLDGKGGGWLVFGSFWDGIKMRRLNDAGVLSTKDSTIYSLARRAKPAEAAAAPPGLPANWQAIEAPFVARHDGYFYLFTSWDLCSITGPYADANGKELADGGGTELLLANSRWLGPGGGSVYQDSQDRSLIVFHAYDSRTGKPSMQLSTIDWTEGWPHADLEQ